MAKSNEKNKQLASHLQRVPEYVNSDTMRREEFLSQIGNFASEHRKIFQALCENWEPGINYNRFVSHNASIRFAEKDLVNLLSRLKTAKCGMLKHKCIDGELKKNTIVLTDTADKSFFYHLIENEIEISMLSSVHPMVTVATLIDQGIVIPDAFVEVLTPRNISRVFFRQIRNDGRIFKIPTSGDDVFVATSDTLPALVTMCLKRIREGLKNSNILSYLAKLQSKAIMELKRDMSTNDPGFWMKLTVTILDAKEEILQKSRTVNPDYFSACELIRFFSENEIKDMEKKRAEEIEMFNEMKTLAHEISREDGFFVDQNELNKKVDRHIDRWPEFKDKFYENFVKARKKTQLPYIVYVGKKYIHRDNIYTYFVANIAQYSVDLLETYEKLMESLIRTNNKSKVSVFYSNENFRNHIREKLGDWDPMMVALLDRPAIVSEAVIHMAKKKMKINDVSRIRTLLENYFEPGKLRFKPLEVLFNLNILEIFQHAFFKIPLWKQLVIRLMGRYDSYRKTFTGMSRPVMMKQTMDNIKTSASRENVPDFENMSREERRREYKKRQSMMPVATRRRSRSRTKEQAVKKKHYSREEQNKAWSEFSESFSKKKKGDKPDHTLSDL